MFTFDSSLMLALSLFLSMTTLWKRSVNPLFSSPLIDKDCVWLRLVLHAILVESNRNNISCISSVFLSFQFIRKLVVLQDVVLVQWNPWNILSRHINCHLPPFHGNNELRLLKKKKIQSYCDSYLQHKQEETNMNRWIFKATKVDNGSILRSYKHNTIQGLKKWDKNPTSSDY